MTREETIYGMCLTLRHDYGLDKNPEDIIGSGMTQSERLILWNSMAQIYDHYISPLKKELDEKNKAI